MVWIEVGSMAQMQIERVEFGPLAQAWPIQNREVTAIEANQSCVAQLLQRTIGVNRTQAERVRQLFLRQRQTGAIPLHQSDRRLNRAIATTSSGLPRISHAKLIG